MKIAIVIKTHDDHRVIDLCIEALKKQTRPADRIFIVDSGSRDSVYLKKHRDDKNLEVLVEAKDIGFCAGNNLAAQRCVYDCDYVFFLNPDAFLPEAFLAELEALILSLGNRKIGVIGPKLLRYDLAAGAPTRVLDTTGIFSNWHGRWQDRGQGTLDIGRFDGPPEIVPAICGAAMVCGVSALQAARLQAGEFFRESFFLYKDDIDLSMRIGARGYDVIFASQLKAYHCRGWQSRRGMPKQFRVMSARNELFVNSQIGLIPRLYSTLKYGLSRLGL
jgi:N-acetylglucosaminyl-diphospho-decaprenol L-rhamnosyltransferase